MSFWTNFRKDIDKAKKIAGAKVKTTIRDFGEGLGIAKEAVITPMQNLQKTLTPDRTQGNIQTSVNKLSPFPITSQEKYAGGMKFAPKEQLKTTPKPLVFKDLQKTLISDKTQDNGSQLGVNPMGMPENLYPETPEQKKVREQRVYDALSFEEKVAKLLPETKTEPLTPTGATGEYDLLSPEGQKQVAEAEAKTGLKGADALRALRGETTTPLQDGMKELGWHPPMALSDEQIEQSPTYQKSVEEQTIGVTDPARAETIKTEIKGIQQQIATYQMLLDRMPGVTPSDKDAYNDLMDTWAEGGASAKDIAQIVDNLTRADENMISNQIMPTYKKYLETTEIKKAKQTMEDLYEKYSNTENDLNDLMANAEKAINAIKQSPYLTQSMIVGRIDKMRDEYNMEISTKQNQLNTLGRDIDRGRSALKDMTTEGFKMAEIEIGSLELGVQEDILGKTGLGWESMAKTLKAEKAGEAPETIGAGRFQYKDKGWEQATPFAPTTPSSKAEKQTVTSEHDYNLQDLANKLDKEGLVPLDAFIEMAQLWMSQTGDYNPDHYFSRFGTKYLSEDDYQDYKYKMSGVKVL